MKVSDFFKRIEDRRKEERKELGIQAIQELLKLDWMKLRIEHSSKIFEDAIRDAVEEFTYDILAHEKEMKQCPKLEELLINITTKQLEHSIPYDYMGIVEQSSHNEYVCAASSVEDIITELNVFLEPALSDLDYDELHSTFHRECEKQ